jgi:hypothetical protein
MCRKQFAIWARLELYILATLDATMLLPRKPWASTNSGSKQIKRPTMHS